MADFRTPEIDFDKDRARLNKRGDRRGMNPGVRKTHCRRGHPLSGFNIYVSAQGYRQCVTCKKAALERWRRRNPYVRTSNHPVQPLVNPTLADYHWAAGFLEGEGSFGWMYGGKRKDGEPKRAGYRVSANQVEWEPIIKLLSLFGGAVYPVDGKKAGPNRSQILLWILRGDMAKRTAGLLYPLMSGKRQSQMRGDWNG